MQKGLFILAICLGYTSFTLGMVAGDSLNYLSVKDTIFLHADFTSEKYHIHTMAPNQTLYSLARFFGLRVEDLYYHNQGLRARNYEIGTQIKIPIPNRAIIRYRDQGFDPSKHVPVYYVVKRGDTMFRISKRFFRMEVDEMIARNGLESANISPGQMLFVGWMNIEGIPDSMREGGGGPLARRNQAMKSLYYHKLGGRKPKITQGVAYWKKRAKDDGDFYALHDRAPINSIIAIDNPMTKRTLYAKVVGKLPPTDLGPNVVVMVSPLAAKYLGAIDARFFVKVHY